MQISKCKPVTFSNLKSFISLKLLEQEIGNHVGINFKLAQ